MNDIHSEFPRPAFPAGSHIRACLTTAPPSTLDALIEFCDRVTRDDCPFELAELMSALQLDAQAARWEVDAQLDAILSAGTTDGLEVDPERLRLLVIAALEAQTDEQFDEVRALVAEHGVDVLIDPDDDDYRIIGIQKLGLKLVRCPYSELAPDVPGGGSHDGIADPPDDV